MEPITIAAIVTAGICLVIATRLYLNQGKLKTQLLESELEFEKQLEKLRIREAMLEQNIANSQTQKDETCNELSLSRQLATDLGEKLAALGPSLEIMRTDVESKQLEIDRLYQELHEAQSRIERLREHSQTLEIENRLVKKDNEDQPQTISRLLAKATESIERKAEEILKTNQTQFVVDAKAKLGEVLNPMKDNLDNLKKQIVESGATEANNIAELKGTIKQLMDGTDKVSSQANALVLAFKGNSKIRGNFGEMVLETVLTNSGLIEGRDYSKQEAFDTEDGRRIPDIILSLPDDNHAIVDSKFVLKDLQGYFEADTDEERKAALRSHCDAIKKHVEELSSKHYAKIKGVKSPGRVYMFLPTEPAYYLALEHEPAIFERAIKKDVVIVCGSTLYTHLSIIAALWKQTRLNKNANAIAAEATSLYEKFVGFLESFIQIDTHLGKSQKAYDEAFKRLSTGRGNVINRVETLRKMGANPKELIPDDIAKDAEAEDSTADVIELPSTKDVFEHA